MSLLPKRTVKDPSTPEERRVTNRNVASIYKGLEYGSYALGGLGLIKKGASLLKAYKARPVTLYRGISNEKFSLKDAKLAITMNKYGVRNEPKGTLTKKFGNWFTTDIGYAKSNIPSTGGSLLKVKVDPKVLKTIKAKQNRQINEGQHH